MPGTRRSARLNSSSASTQPTARYAGVLRATAQRRALRELSTNEPLPIQEQIGSLLLLTAATEALNEASRLNGESDGCSERQTCQPGVTTTGVPTSLGPGQSPLCCRQFQKQPMELSPSGTLHVNTMSHTAAFTTGTQEEQSVKKEAHQLSSMRHKSSCWSIGSFNVNRVAGASQLDNCK